MTTSAPRGATALLGGTFDPPHFGHLVVAEEALHQLGVTSVRFLVAGKPWMKGATSSPEHRVAMTELAVADREDIVVDARETGREGPTYTVDTLEDLRAEGYTDMVFLLGVDAAASLPQWHRGGDALALARFVVVTRPGYTLPALVAADDRLERLEVPPLAISSTMLRARFATGAPVRYQLPDAVADYAREHDLYGAEPS